MKASAMVTSLPEEELIRLNKANRSTRCFILIECGVSSDILLPNVQDERVGYLAQGVSVNY